MISFLRRRQDGLYILRAIDILHYMFRMKVVVQFEYWLFIMIGEQLALEITQPAIFLVLIDINRSGRRPGGHHRKRPTEKAAIFFFLITDVVVNPSTGIYVVVVIAIVVKHWDVGVSEEHYACIALGVVDFKLCSCLAFEILTVKCTQGRNCEAGIHVYPIGLLTFFPSSLIVRKEHGSRNFSLFVAYRK